MSAVGRATFALVMPLPRSVTTQDELLRLFDRITPTPRGCQFCRSFPPTNIVVGGLDPLLDDAIDFNTRLRRLNVPVRS